MEYYQVSEQYAEVALYNKDIKEVVSIILDNPDKEEEGLKLLAEFNQRIVDLFDN